MKTALLLALCALAASPARAKTASPFELLLLEGGDLRAGRRLLKEKDRLAYGVRLKLSAGRAVIGLGSAGKLMLRGPAEFTPQEDSVNLRSGALLGVLPFLKGKFSVRTPNVTAAVRGTDFFIEARKHDESYVCLCSGALDLTSEGDERFRLKLQGSRHDAALLLRGSSRLSQAPAAMAGHTDAEIEELKAPPRIP